MTQADRNVSNSSLNEKSPIALLQDQQFQGYGREPPGCVVQYKGCILEADRFKHIFVSQEREDGHSHIETGFFWYQRNMGPHVHKKAMNGPYPFQEGRGFLQTIMLEVEPYFRHESRLRDNFRRRKN